MKSLLSSLAAIGLLASSPVALAAAQQANATPNAEGKPRPAHFDKFAPERGVPVAVPLAPKVVVEQDYEPNPAIWKLADEDTTIYLFGTIHLLPEGFRWRSESLEKVIAEVDEVVFESRDDDIEQDIAEMEFFSKLRASFNDRATISSRLSEQNRAKWEQVIGHFAPTATSASKFDRLPPAFFSMMVSMAILEDEGSYSEFGVETVLENEFRKASKPIGAIEDPIAVLRAILAIDETKWIRVIDEALAEWDGNDVAGFLDLSNENSGIEQKEDPFADLHAWAKGEPDRLDFDDWLDNALGRAMYDVLLVDRNRAWAEWLEKRLDSPGKVLVAVGAGHFEGGVSVQKMLAERGLEAVRLD